MATITCAGCGILPLLPVQNKNEEMKVTWEDNEDQQVTVKYNKKKDKIAEDKRAPSKAQQEGLRTDTVSPDFLPLYTEIGTWMGTPYGYGQKEKMKGTDCSGFTQEVFRVVYQVSLSRSAEGQAAETREIKKEDLRTGDLVFFNINGNRISHVGLYLGNQKFVHATVKSGVMVSDLNEKYYSDRHVRSGRVVKTP